MGIATTLDKAGPALASGIILAILGAGATSAMAWRDLLSTSDVRFSSIAAELDRLRADLDGFRAPGGRFTAHDGDRHWQRMDDIDKRLRDQEQRPPRLNPHLSEVETRVRTLEDRVTKLEFEIAHLEGEQERLCQRLQACKGNSK